MWGMTGLTSTAVDEQNTYAALRDMYESYKVRKKIIAQNNEPACLGAGG